MLILDILRPGSQEKKHNFAPSPEPQRHREASGKHPRDMISVGSVE
jgi:hypothetical protein